jgi:hypothetical protein
MTKSLPFTVASTKRLIEGVERAGRFVVGIKADGTLIVADKPLDVTSLIPAEAQPSPTAERRMGDYFHGGSSEAQGA